MKVNWRMLGIDGYDEGLWLYREWRSRRLWAECFAEAYRAGIKVSI
jgi:hypothetical protein